MNKLGVSQKFPPKLENAIIKVYVKGKRKKSR